MRGVEGGGGVGSEGARLRAVSDGVVTIRPPGQGDRAVLVAGRDAEFHRWMGSGTEDPSPTACVVVGSVKVGWLDTDLEQEWLQPGEVNVGYNIFAPHRGRGYASRAVQLFGHHLALRTEHQVMTLLIDAGNERSLAMAKRLGFSPAGGRRGQPTDQRYFMRSVPPITYTDGVVTIRSLTVDDIDADLEAKDDEQISWLWLPGQREQWEAMTPDQQRAHALRGLCEAQQSFGTGPKWRFAADTPDARYVAYVDCDLANDHVLAGEANISYSAHVDHRGHGHVSRAVRLAMRFLADHTGAREAHIIVDPRNVASVRVVRSVGARESGELLGESGQRMTRHVLPISRNDQRRPSTQ
jgi:RimJ/RimL family protein N-acetyltransferase